MVTFRINGEGFKGCTVPGTEAGLVGCYDGGIPYRPNNEAVRAALPYRWRKAFDRAGGAWWFNGDSAHVCIRDGHGRNLTIIYAHGVKG
ncbi:hypothetical protein [Bradyrhizobium sp. SZCCHNR3015]|uniref:hypothetical protein n=1 Tax=Bradyrhizobium sp. SZCCHNR3015 TaxID=3057395 RepID=UPI002916BED7|nr:hypothetical protein [Bradyrhizobium sp. SZCCHNR3015]